MRVAWLDLLSTYRYAYLAAVLIALGCSIVGVYVVLRRVSFVGIATAQIAGAGVALAFFLHLAPLPAAVLSALAGVLLFSRGRSPVRVPRDGIVAVAFAVASAVSVLLVSRSGAELDQVEHIIYGSLLFTTSHQVVVLACGMAAIVVIHVLFAREFLMVSFDVETARTLGVRTGLFNVLLFLSFGVVIALSIGTAGSLLAFAFLILPPMTGLLLVDRLGRVFAASIATAIATAVAGVLFSILFDFPTGPAIVVTAAGFLLSALSYRVHPALGAATLVGLIAWTVVSARDDAPRPAGSESAASVESFHVDLELVAHETEVRRGAVLAVDYVIRIRGAAPANLYLVIDAGDALGVEKLPLVSKRAAGRVEIATGELAPARYTLSASLWTGDPLEPDEGTELLPPDVCSAKEVVIEVRP